MKFDGTLTLFMIVLVAVASLNRLALSWSLYWIYPWFDIPVHFLGGVAVGLGSQTALFRRVVRLDTRSVVRCLVIVCAVGVAWEIFEYLGGLSGYPADAYDTIIDLIMDLTGGLLGYGTARLIAHIEQYG